MNKKVRYVCIYLFVCLLYRRYLIQYHGKLQKTNEARPSPYSGLLQGRGWGGGASAPPFFGRSINPTQPGGHIIPTQYYKPPRFSDLATALLILLLFLTPRLALSSHQHRNLPLSAYFWSGNLHSPHQPIKCDLADTISFDWINVFDYCLTNEMTEFSQYCIM